LSNQGTILATQISSTQATTTNIPEKKFNFIKSKNEPTQKIENPFENISNMNIVNNTMSGLITVDLTKSKIIINFRLKCQY
jgi:hypothetical protein